MASSASKDKDCPVLVRALNDFMQTGAQVHKLMEVVVTEAVQLAIARVASEYPIEYNSLVARHCTDIVHHLCGTFLSTAAGEGACAALTKSGKPCGKRAGPNGYCGLHLGAWQQQQAATRASQHYAEAMQRDKRAMESDMHVDELAKTAGKRTVSMAGLDNPTHVM